jgi:sugar (pentulose or hexulose) kinase
MNVIGMDLGTQRVKAVLLKDGEVVSRGQALSGFDPIKAAEQAVDEAH